MVERAVIRADMYKNEIATRFNKNKSQKQLLGLTLLERAILTANAAGIEKFTIILGDNHQKIKNKLFSSPYLKNKNVDLDFFVNPNFQDENDRPLFAMRDLLHEDFLYFACDSIYSKNIIEEMLANSSSFEEEVLVYLNKNTGLFIIKRSFLDDEGWNNVTKIEDLLENKRIGAVEGSEGFWQKIDSFETLKKAEKKLLNSVRKPTDGVISRNLNRYISLFISKYLLKVHAVPNVVTVGNLIVGLMSAYYISLGGYFNSLIGVLLFQVASITDGCDGEIAKLTFRSSKFGEWFDTACDNITYVAFLFCLPIGLYRYHQDVKYIILGFVTFASAVSFVWMMVRHNRRMKSGGSMVTIVKTMESEAKFDLKSAKKTLNFLMSKIAFIMRRDFFAFAFLVLSLVDCAFVIQWTAAIALLGANIYFYFYSEDQFKSLTLNTSNSVI